MKHTPWWAKLLESLTQRRMVVLVDHDTEITMRWARPVSKSVLECYRFPFHTGRCLLLPDGRVVGPCYVYGWTLRGDYDRLDTIIRQVLHASPDV